jgi:N-acetylmuramoyl-L-alanine amidase
MLGTLKKAANTQFRMSMSEDIMTRLFGNYLLNLALLIGVFLFPAAAISEAPDKGHDYDKFLVALDIGHTPRNGGAAAADGTMEYEFNRRMVQLIAADLREQPNITVIVVNNQRKEISLFQRSTVANEASADLFLAIHHDSANDKYLVPRIVNGRTLYSTDRFSGYSVFFSRKNAAADESLRFAKLIGSAMRDEGLMPTAHHAEKIPGENRDLIVPELGVYRYDNLIVLRTTRMPAVLLECGVIVNPTEEEELKQPERQMKVVRAVRAAVLTMAGKKPPKAELP